MSYNYPNYWSNPNAKGNGKSASFYGKSGQSFEGNWYGKPNSSYDSRGKGKGKKFKKSLKEGTKVGQRVTTMPMGHPWWMVPVLNRVATAIEPGN